ncbi:MAG TPA: family 43 glycosylhydrolase [Candidatus Limnocylindrales bacterium]|nr:family 43 glycosylhydrolase [Candidatus Limnocylindrales bacterium]
MKRIPIGLLPLCLVLVLAGCYGDTEAAENVTATSATLTAWGVTETASTDFYFDYGTTTQFGQRTPVQHPDGLTPGRNYPIAENVTGLTPGTRYYYRLCGKERAETSYRCGNTRSLITKVFTNPPRANNFNSIFKTYSIGDYREGDVKIVRVNGRYYGSGSGCTLRVSSDLLNWDYVATHDDGTGHQVPTEVCGTAAGMHPPNGVLQPVQGDQNVNFWGTEVIRVGPTWVLVTSFMRPWSLAGRHAGYSRGAIYVATASNPAGPYTWAADATAKDADSTLIDPSLFVDPQTGRVWLTYVQHRDFPNWTLNNELRAIELDPANLTLPRAGATSTLLMSTAINPQPREVAFPQSGQRIIEGQGIFVHDGQYFFYYAAGTVEYDYASFGGTPYTLNVASSATFPALFTKPAGPTLSGANGWRLPGHGAFFQDGDGAWWTAMSPYRDGDSLCEPTKSALCGFARTVFLQKATYHHDTHTFTVGNGQLQPGPLGVPVP